MSGRLARIWRTLGEPVYRTKLAFFVLLGIVVVMLAVFFRSDVFWSSVLVQFAVTFTAVGLLELLWDFVGGEPTALRLEEIKKEVDDIKISQQTVEEIKSELKTIKSSVDLLEEVKAEVDRLKPPMIVLSDLMDQNIGLERIWPNRRAWQGDLTDGLLIWQGRVCNAKTVEIVSSTLWNNWVHQNSFRNELFKSIAGGAQVRILIYDPDSDVLRQRAKDEKDVPGEMEQEIKATLLRLAEGWRDLSPSAKEGFQLRLTTRTLHPVHMIRADERMLIAIYLSGQSGGPCPTFQIRSSESAYFRTYSEQFQTLWGRAQQVDSKGFERILKDYGDLAPPTTEN